MSARLGIDIGGTFTDFALWRNGRLILEKTLSTPEDRSDAVVAGIERLANAEGCSVRALLGELDAVVHGTTVADNTLIEGTGAVTGLLTTQGFRDELELRRGYKEDIWDVRLPPPPPLVPRRRRLTVPERVLHDGRIHRPLDEAAAREAIRKLGRQGVESIAVATLFSFVNPVHERRLAELVREELGEEVTLSLSHQVMPKAPEYERTSTTALNAYLGPRVSAYLERLSARLRGAGLTSQLLVMQASGDVMTLDYLRASPVRVLASGPAAGVIGAAEAGRRAGAADLLCVDMGGTSYDVSVVRGGAAPAQPGWNWHHRHVVGLPMVQVETLGAGGGSLCQVRGGVLQVGPGSAGALPGPVCLGRGGTRPTITDAILVMGILSPERGLAGGRIPLTRAGVDAAFEEHVSGPLGSRVADAARDCWRVVNANMSQAVRRLTAEKGIDPRGLTLVAYGGNGPAFACEQADALGIRRVWVPRASPAFSALGTLVARPGIDEEQAYLRPVASARRDELSSLWEGLHALARSQLRSAGFGDADLETRYQLNLRYPGQNWPLTLDLAGGSGACDLGFVDDALADRVREAFHRSHEAEYGHRREAEEPEVTGVRLRMQARVVPPALPTGPEAGERAATPQGERDVDLGAGPCRTPIYDGNALRPGDCIEAPAVIEETFTTVVVQPGWRARLSGDGDIHLEASEDGGPAS